MPHVCHWTIAILLSAAPFGAAPAFAQAERGTTAGGLFYEARGAGEAIVFIHAFSVDLRMWDPQVAAFEAENRVVRYDLRGHGRSAPPEGVYSGFDDLRALLDELEIDKATLVGLSAGSALAIDFAIAHPGRVDRLVLAAPGLGGYRTPPLPWAQPVFEAAGAGDAERAARLWAETPMMALHTNLDAAATVNALVMDNGKLWTYRRTEQPLTPPAVTRLGEVTCPVLIIVGEADLPHVRDVADVIVSGVPGARTMTIPGAGHLVSLDTPGQFNEAVARFLRGQ